MTERLFQQIRSAGYFVLMTDASGVAVDLLSDYPQQDNLLRLGFLPGVSFSESNEGTCAVGLCAIERSAITIHQSEHYRSAHKLFTCSAAPICDETGELIAILDASALHSPDDRRSQQLVLQMVSSAASAIENIVFLGAFKGKQILRVSAHQYNLSVFTEGLLALEDDGTIAGLNRHMHAVLPAGSSMIGTKLSDIADGRSSILRNGDTVTLEICEQSFFARLGEHEGLRPPSAIRSLKTPSLTRLSEHASTRATAELDPRLISQVRRAARALDNDVPLLLLGETGTGKEHLANYLHNASRRARASFVALNCAAIPESLIEGELFGYRKGAFTGAHAQGFRGRIVEAHGGTLFLDEIGDMPLGLQTRLLRVLAEREVTPLGAPKSVPVDIRIICATHRNLLDLVADGRFRQDLYFRLNGMSVQLPTLRDRSDKEALIFSTLASEADKIGRPDATISPSAMRLLLAHPWPGNIRQLKNVLRLALAIDEDGIVGIADLPSDLEESHEGGAVRVPSYDGSFASSHAHEEPHSLAATLAKHGWNISRTAKALGIRRSTIYRRMHQLGIKPHRDKNLVFPR
ncbi:sigma-54-dependent Fis family transcriptional regulator [Bradyrhizobium liaoningense]